MRRIQKFVAVGGSAALLTLTLTPAALAAGSVRQSVGKGVVRAASTYKGKTSQGKSITLTVGSGKVNGKVAWSASCGSAGTLKGTFSFQNVPVSGGSFSHAFKGTTPINSGQYEDHWSAKIAGTIGKSKANGTFSDNNAIFSGSSKVAQCNTGKLTWKATKS